MIVVQFKESRSRRRRDKYRWSAGAVVLKFVLEPAEVVSSSLRVH